HIRIEHMSEFNDLAGLDQLDTASCGWRSRARRPHPTWRDSAGCQAAASRSELAPGPCCWPPALRPTRPQMRCVAWVSSPCACGFPDVVRPHQHALKQAELQAANKGGADHSSA